MFTAVYVLAYTMATISMELRFSLVHWSDFCDVRIALIANLFDMTRSSVCRFGSMLDEYAIGRSANYVMVYGILNEWLQVR